MWRTREHLSTDLPQWEALCKCCSGSLEQFGGWNSAATSHELFHWKMFASCHIFEGFPQTRCFSQDTAHSPPSRTDSISCFFTDSWAFQNYWQQGIFWITINDSSASSQPEPLNKRSGKSREHQSLENLDVGASHSECLNRPSNEGFWRLPYPGQLLASVASCLVLYLSRRRTPFPFNATDDSKKWNP